MMRQKGVTKEALSVIKDKCLSMLDKQGLTLKKAFRKKKGEIGNISIGGTTLRKIYDGDHVHTDTITNIILELGESVRLEKGLICIAEKVEGNENCNNN